MSTSSPSIERLPNDVFGLLVALLTGFDLLQLSHASPALNQHQLRISSELWEARAAGMPGSTALQAWLRRSTKSEGTISNICGIVLRIVKSTLFALSTTSSADTKPSLKKLYLSNASLRFPGRDQGPRTRRERGGAVEIPAHVSNIVRSNSFSLELWFALQPSSTGNTPTHVGGVLLGAQSKHWTVGDQPRYCQPFIHVDPQGTLYCSVTRTKTPVASTLRLQQWYHLMLTYEQTAGSKQGAQCVYLDGSLIHSSVDTHHQDTKELHHMQLGTGCMNIDSPGSPTTKSDIGWYGFNGVVGGCRVWNVVLPPEQVVEVHHKDGGAAETAATTYAWSLMEDADALFYGPMTCVRTTRPRERFCVELFGEVQLPGPMVPFIHRQVPRC